MRGTHLALVAFVALLIAGGLLLYRSTQSEPVSRVGGETSGTSKLDRSGDRGAVDEGTTTSSKPEKLPTEENDEPGDAIDEPLVRDYRSDKTPVDPNAVIRRPFKTKRIDAKVVARMGSELRRLAIECREKFPGEVGEGARAQPRATFSILEGRLTVTDVELSLTEIEENGEFRSCLESAVVGVAIEAPEHRDVERDTMTVPIRLQRRR